MKTESTVKPNKYDIEERENGKVAVLFFTNIEEKLKDEQKIYSYDKYTFITKNQLNLKERIEQNYNNWLEYAKNIEVEKLSKEIRQKRDELLKESDSEMCLDRIGLVVPEDPTFSSWLSFFRSIGDLITGKWAKYRQALRDIPQQPDFPYNVTFPTKPTKEEREE